MSEDLVVEVLFASAAIAAGLAAVGAKVFARVEKVALAVCLAAAAFFVQATNIL